MEAAAVPPRGDLLRWPILGPFLRWRHARTTVQVASLVASAVVVLHGLFGPDLAPRNLATVLVWVHYRGLLIVLLLAAGNVFCGACPFVLVRDAGRRLRPPSRRWPVRLRGKWIGIALLASVLLVYEWLDLWSWPRGTAVLLLGYFALVFAVDMTFTGATFCKHLCPIGQYNFVASTLSPLEVRVKDPAGCGACRTHDCIRGRREPVAPQRVTQRGCELGLFLPSKVGNLDCTFCLDCVQACPHDNVVVATRPPGAELTLTTRRSGIGRLHRRPDLAALTAVFTFAALLNAFAMTGPVYALERWISEATGIRNELPVLIGLFAAALFGLPLAALLTAAAATRRVTRDPRPSWAIAVRYAYALAPIGVGIWAAHYGFHFLTGMLTVIPVVQSAAQDLLTQPLLGVPRWTWVGLAPGPVYVIEMGCLLLGLVGSAAVAGDIARQDHPERAGLASVPWIVLVVALAGAAAWVLSQPMEMRGTVL